jgi:acetoin utilization deacetylase AcuC-like enzyme
MVLVPIQASTRLLDCGILIPVSASKRENILAELSRVQGLTPGWRREGFEERLERDDLLRVHDSRYVERLYGPGLEREILETYELIDESGRPYRYDPEKAIRPLSELFRSILIEAAGTYAAARIALKTGFCFDLDGGMHHARSDAGSGFCLLNDILICIFKLISKKEITRAWIIDVDAHKGDGTASILARKSHHASSRILDLDIHMARGWPLDPETLAKRGPDNPSLVPADIDIPIGEGEEAKYLPALREGLGQLEVLSRRRLGGLPDLALVVDGSDPYELDELPSTRGLRLSLEQLLERDVSIKSFLDSKGIPSVWLTAGGYGRNSYRVYANFLKNALRKAK